MVAIPTTAGVKTPPVLMVPMLDGVTDHVTALLKLPIPDTVGVHVAV
jgi:hypothetical protein